MHRSSAHPLHVGRRKFLATTAAAGLGSCFSVDTHTADGRAIVHMQLGWLAGGNQLGEVVAKRKGFLDDEAIHLEIHPGGPNIDGVSIVASGRYNVGQVASSPSLMLAVSQGIPIRCFGICVQEHPYSYFSLPRNPVRSPRDMIGKKVGTNATGRILLDALLKKHDIDPGSLEVVVIGSSMSPILTGQVDVVSGWTTNTTALKSLGADRITMRLWEQGIRLYAMPYYATLGVLEQHQDLLAGFLRAVGRGWEFAYRNPEEATALLVEEYPILRYEDELVSCKQLLGFVFTDATESAGWAAMDVTTWEEQIRVHDELGQFTLKVPTIDDLLDMGPLRATAADRPHLGAGPYRADESS